MLLSCDLSCRTNFMGYSPPKEGGLWYYLNEKKAGKGVSFGWTHPGRISGFRYRSFCGIKIAGGFEDFGNIEGRSSRAVVWQCCWFQDNRSQNKKSAKQVDCVRSGGGEGETSLVRKDSPQQGAGFSCVCVIQKGGRKDESGSMKLYMVHNSTV